MKLQNHTSLEAMGVYPDLLIISGSKMYGTDNPNSDMDIRGMVLPPAEYLLGRKSFEQAKSDEPDYTIWSLPKFIHLLEVGSPNVFELLFATKIKFASPLGLQLLGSSNLFISKHIVKPCIGFAQSEWKSVERSKGDVGGFRFKSASHSIRILEQTTELLLTGTITFPRPNAVLLRQIKFGEVPYEACEALYQKALTDTREAEVRSKLPDGLDKSKIDVLYYDLIRDRIREFLRV